MGWGWDRGGERQRSAIAIAKFCSFLPKHTVSYVNRAISAVVHTDLSIISCTRLGHSVRARLLQ